jgi:hypothetical protein
MLDWISERYPFSRDSIYMIGGSMGGAAPLVWNNNNCGLSDYMIAASVSGSPILDCMLRQMQYLDSGHINNSMIAAFGGLPGESEQADFEYHRYSEIYLADTTQSMYFNSLHLPAYVTWGTTDSSWSAEWYAYGRPALAWDSLRHADGADTTVAFCSGINAHGYQVMHLDSVLDWLSGFSVNRFPQHLSINADESDEYFWTRVTLSDNEYTFGRYGADYNIVERRLDINLIRNIATIDVEFQFPWWDFDSLRGNWINRDSIAIPWAVVRLTDLPTPVLSVERNGQSMPFVYASGILTMLIPPSGDYVVQFDPLHVHPPVAQLPQDIRVTST